jgi:non-specific serine/threonine protein kinase
MVDPAEKPVSAVAAGESASAAVETLAPDRILHAALGGFESTHAFSDARTSEAGKPPEQLGRYRVLRLLGYGAFGGVWLAADDELRRQVAIKLVPADRLIGDECDAYLREARTLAALDHPHIVPIYDVGRTDAGAVYVVSKYIEGTTLYHEISERQLNLDEAVAIVQTIAEAVGHAHQRNLIHRDIKPANVLIESGSGRVYLADFGLAQGPGSDEASGISGTPAYMSPEQACGEVTDARSDLFSLGVVLYELLSGERPFHASKIVDLLDTVKAARFKPLQQAADHVPAELARICEKLLQRNPVDRYSAANELAEDLSRWQEQRRREAERTQIVSNLPAQPGQLIGREREVAEVRRRLLASRVLTLTGIGGVGKTSLAIGTVEGLLDSFPDGVFFIELAPLSDAAFIAPTIAQTMSCRLPGQATAEAELAQAIADRQLLLVLDNCEHLRVAERILPLLKSCPQLRILATSRAPLRVAGEAEFPVSLLDVPDLQQLTTSAEIADFPAMQLFMQCAREVLPGFELTDQHRAAVAEICVRLDGLPLAIELAAARIKVLSPPALLERLKTGFQVLSSRRADVPARRQTLRQAIQWSYELLAPAEQQLFRRLGVFSGGFTLEAAERVAGDEIEVLDGVETLVDNSLLRRSGDLESDRFQLLETVREFARELLQASGEGDDLSRRHATWIMELVEACESKLQGSEVARYTKRLNHEHANVRAALGWCLAAPNDAGRGEIGLRIAGALWRYWCTGGHLREAHDWLKRLLDAYGTQQGCVGAKARYAAGCVAEDLGEYALARQRYEESLRLWEQAGDTASQADASIALGSIANSQGDYVAAGDFFRRALDIARQVNDRRRIAVALSNLGSIGWCCGDYDLARQYHTEALAIRRELGNRAGVSISLTSLGLIASREGDLQGAKILYEESLGIMRELDNPAGIGVCLNNLGEISYRLGELDAAEVMLWEALHIQHRIGDRLSMAYTLESIAAAAQQQGSFEAAVRFFAAAEGLRKSLGAPLPPLEKVSNDKVVHEVRIALGPERFIALWTAALATPLDRIVAEGHRKA